MQIDSEVRRIILEAYERAKLLLRRNLAVLHKMAEALLERESLDGPDIDEIVRQVGAETPRPRRPESRPAGRSGAWRPARGPLALDRPVLMGVLNATPDSFSDGGRISTRRARPPRRARWSPPGAALLDLGGESTRPGARAGVGARGARAACSRCCAAVRARRPRAALGRHDARRTSPRRRSTPAPTS